MTGSLSAPLTPDEAVAAIEAAVWTENTPDEAYRGAIEAITAMCEGRTSVMFEPADADDVDGAIKWDDDDEPRPYAFTRDELVSALTRIEVRPVGGKVVAEWMADAIIQVLEEANDG